MMLEFKIGEITNRGSNFCILLMVLCEIWEWDGKNVSKAFQFERQNSKIPVWLNSPTLYIVYLLTEKLIIL